MSRAYRRWKEIIKECRSQPYKISLYQELEEITDPSQK